VKERNKYSRNWFLQKGDNHELVETKAHEREAFENFGVYKNDFDNDRFVLSTSKLAELPAKERLGAIMMMMNERWKVKDGQRGFDKAKMALQAIECFAEMRELEQIPTFADMTDEDQDSFLLGVESCMQFAQRSFHQHPDAVAMMIRAADICDTLRCSEKRDEVLQMAEKCANRIGRAYAFEREGEELPQPPPPTFQELHDTTKTRHFDELRRWFPRGMKEQDEHRKMRREQYFLASDRGGKRVRLGQLPASIQKDLHRPKCISD
jgi:hypothetical protein